MDKISSVSEKHMLRDVGGEGVQQVSVTNNCIYIYAYIKLFMF